MWKTLIQEITNECKFFPPATSQQIIQAEHSLEIALPEELKNLLRESNGVHGENGLGLIWPIENIVKDNLEFRRTSAFKDLYMPFDSLLFFADNGGGDQFAFTILNGTIRRSDIFVWNHETDSRTWAAPSLQKYLDWTLNDKINL